MMRMEAMGQSSSSSFLQLRDVHAGSAATSLCSSYHISKEICLAPLRISPAPRNVAIKASFGAGQSSGMPFSSTYRSRIFPNLFPSSSSSLRSSRIQSAKKTYTSFDDLLKTTDTPLLVDFYATWCGPCQFMVPVLNDVGHALKNKLRIVKIDTEKYPAIASKYDVHALPTLILFLNGKPIDRLEGALTAPDLIRRIEGVLGAKSKTTQ
ncbi:hypothetical protein KP509_15G075400 [Ceratopteris richardii]|uniref:Thioredoxin domain-containing protein n=1 Tax=Ceratopteris richardii TaxID=49495 RepID=A0A8T2T8M9_CERRI|nr:hypothetical protein KP509_15G075400 [Ceratopteris richardii]